MNRALIEKCLREINTILPPHGPTENLLRLVPFSQIGCFVSNLRLFVLKRQGFAMLLVHSVNNRLMVKLRD